MSTSPQQSAQIAPDWLVLAEADGRRLDVRPLLESGEDPLLQVLQMSMTVPPDAFMVVEAPFNPLPLRNVLAGQGFSSWAQRLGDSHWRISFRRDGLGTGGEDAGGEACGAGGKGNTWEQDGATHIDVRGLTPPLPMILILRLVQRSSDDAVVIVHHEREPMYLVPELAELGWRIEPIDGDPGEVRLKIMRMTD